MIGHYINEIWRGRDKDCEIELNYQTREKSSDFFQYLQINSNNDVEIDNSNIDYFHISTAYKTINDWVKNKENIKFTKDSFIDKLINQTKVIWYETLEKDSISIFARLNSGKTLTTHITGFHNSTKPIIDNMENTDQNQKLASWVKRGNSSFSNI